MEDASGLSSANAAPTAHMGRRGRFHLWAFSPASSSRRVDCFFRLCARLLLIMHQEFIRTHLALRAAALTYSILLSLVPILALSTSILKGLGNDEQLKTTIVRFIYQWEPPIRSEGGGDITATSPPSADVTITSGASNDRVPSPISTNLHRAVDLIFQYVDRTNFAALGIIGIIGLIGVIFLVLSSIEEAMNAIWHTHKGRSLSRKLMDYLGLLLLLPLSLNVALAAEAILANERIMRQLSMMIPSAWMAALFFKLVPFMFIVLTLMIMYLFFPHTKVHSGAALPGALFASFFWFVFQKMYITLQIGVANYNAIYGSFASIPLFLIWLQIGWTFILLGASLAYAIQHQHHYRFSISPASPQKQLQLAFDILHLVYKNFDNRHPTSIAALENNLPGNTGPDIQKVISLLVQGGLLRVTEHQTEESLLPVTPADRMSASEVVRLVLGGESGPSHGGQLAAEAITAASDALNGSFSQFSSRRRDHENSITTDHS